MQVSRDEKHTVSLRAVVDDTITLADLHDFVIRCRNEGAPMYATNVRAEGSVMYAWWEL